MEIIETPKEALDRAINVAGGMSALAKTLNLSGHQVIYQWGLNRVPSDYCPLIEKITGGLVRCEDLRPDVAWGVLRNAPAQEKAVA